MFSFRDLSMETVEALVKPLGHGHNTPRLITLHSSLPLDKVSPAL